MTVASPPFTKWKGVPNEQRREDEVEESGDFRTLPQEDSVRSIVRPKKPGTTAWTTPEVEAVIRERLVGLEAFERAVLGSIAKEQETAIKAIPKGEWNPEKQRQISDFINQQIEKNQAVADWVVEQYRDQFDAHMVPDELDFRRWLAWKWYFTIPGDD